MDPTIQELARTLENPDDWLARLKERDGRRLIGCFPMRVPHELIDAAGMTPIDICGGSGEMTAAAEYLQNIVCYPVRSAFERLLTGRLKSLDGAVFTSLCAGATVGGGLWQWLNKVPYYHLLTVRHGENSELASRYYKYQLEGLRGSLEALAGHAITNEALAQSIKRYNESRTLLDRLAALSRQNPKVLSAQDLAVVSAASGIMPRTEYTQLLTKLRASLPTPSAGSGTERVKMVLAGNLCDYHQTELLSTIEESGGSIVEDDSPFGRRLRQRVAENVDPIDALVAYYMDSPPCPSLYFRNLQTNVDYLAGLAKTSGADGVLFVRPKYCDALGLDYPLITEKLGQAGIATLSLDVDDRQHGSSQAQVRLQAFIEMLRG